jgi:tRNA pseudouridine55 synthase
MATGLLVLAAGAALKLQDRLAGARKVYRARILLGRATDTDDATGKTLFEKPADVDEAALRAALARFRGPQKQKVPRYSAVKVGGRKLYELAREGTEVDLPVKDVEIFRLELLRYERPEAEVVAECSKGTYVRALARDLGEALGTGACLSALRRESIGSLQREQAYSWLPGPAPAGALEKAFLPMDRVAG